MCDYRGPSIFSAPHTYACVDGRLYIAPSAHIEMDDDHGPCPSCNLDAWVEWVHLLAVIRARLRDDGQQPYAILTALLTHPDIRKLHGAEPWRSAAHQGLLWTLLLDTQNNTAWPPEPPLPIARIHWPWPGHSHTTSAHMLLAIRAATEGYTPPAHAQQDADGRWISPLEPNDHEML